MAQNSMHDPLPLANVQALVNKLDECKKLDSLT